jgi:hypothetical protein
VISQDFSMTVSKRAARSAVLVAALGLGALFPTQTPACAWGCGANPGHLDSGYERLRISPGIEVRAGWIRQNADVAPPIYQHLRNAASLDVADSVGQPVAPAIQVQPSDGF